MKRHANTLTPSSQNKNKNKNKNKKSSILPKKEKPNNSNFRYDNQKGRKWRKKTWIFVGESIPYTWSPTTFFCSTFILKPTPKNTIMFNITMTFKLR